MLRKIFTASLLFSFTLGLSACYRVPVPQGNELTPQLVARIKPGMSEYRVVSILGSPVLTNTFANNQIAYVYTYKKGTSPMKVKRTIVYFKGKTVSHVTSDLNGPNAAIPSP